MPIVFKNMRKFYKTVIISLAITLSVEVFQYFIGRSSDIVDVLTNFLGGIIGYVVFKGLNQLCKSSKYWNTFIGNDM